ncbi:hypothetical protein CAC42_7 [Sphaceloma murrayae]|uniref:Phosphoglycerate mutase-like protein n=1 Tax=Sphaceloma murrayae TaxID=2082308 RepID=A0A2K1QS34_9PEZI|nr:hypothetical protein CAC42_7 [Sphaceloma murrayae]
MPPTIILIRHGEAQHNATRDYNIPDPPLTAKGEEQCRHLHSQLLHAFPLAHEVEAIITSPFLRTLQTTTIGLDFLIKRGIKVEPDALWQENSAKPCDTGSTVAMVQARFPDIDFLSVDPVFPRKEGVYAFTKTAVLARGRAVLGRLRDRPEKVIAVVSHSGFLRTAVSRRHYHNADFRVFTFGTDIDGDVNLIESPLTEGRGGLGWSHEGVAEVREDEFPVEKEVGTEATHEVP